MTRSKGIDLLIVIFLFFLLLVGIGWVTANGEKIDNHCKQFLNERTAKTF